MAEQPELWLAVLPCIEFFESHHVSYYVGGSVASSYSGVARATQDADLVADLRPAVVPLLIAELEGAYYLSRDRILDAVRRRKSFNLIHLETAFKLDVFVASRDTFARQSLARRVSLEVPEIGRRVDFCTPEDIVLNKLLWYEEGNQVSDRQWYDLQGVLRMQQDKLDRAYLRKWAEEFGIKALLDRAFEDAFPPKSQGE